MVFVVTDNANSTAASLRRLVEAGDPPERVFLVTDQRRPLMRGAKGEEYLARLREGCAGQFRHVELTAGDYAELDALRAVVARSRPLGEAEAIESLHRQGRYRAAPLLRDLLGEAAPVHARAGVIGLGVNRGSRGRPAGATG